MKKRILKVIKNMAITALVLLVVLIAIGAAYIWFVGKNANVDISQADTTDTAAQQTTLKHVQPAANTPESASVQMLSSPVVPGSNVTMSVKTKPYSECLISVIYDKTASTDSGLVTKKADDFGTVEWTWTVEASAPLGKWPAKVTCSYAGKSAVVVGDLELVSSVD